MAMAIPAWMIGAGVLAAAGIGVAVYETVKQQPLAAGPPGPVIPPGASADQVMALLPDVTPLGRPQNVAATPGAHATIVWLQPSTPGPTAIGPFKRSDTVGSVRFLLPSGAKWKQLILGVSTPPPQGTPKSKIDFRGDFTSGVALSYASLFALSAAVCIWTDASGTDQMSAFTWTVV